MTRSSGDIGDTTGPSSECGDGERDGDEECDLGYGRNNDHAACNDMCEAASCGDGKIWTGMEACDDGRNNNDALYGGCTKECQLGPRCGDGIMQADEECDLGEENGSEALTRSGVACDATCRYDARVAFLSSLSYSGWELLGAGVADAKCRTRAQAAGLDNADGFKAWLSDAEHSPAQDFAVEPDKPYISTTGTLIAAGWNDLLISGPGDDGIIITEHQDKALGVYVWTATGPDGQRAALGCGDWPEGSPDAKQWVGQSGLDKNMQAKAWEQWKIQRHWTGLEQYPCDKKYRLYCFEQ